MMMIVQINFIFQWVKNSYSIIVQCDKIQRYLYAKSSIKIIFINKKGRY